MKRANGEGSIYKRKDGRWCGAYYDNSSTPKRHTVYGKTQTEVRKKIKERLENLEVSFSEEGSYTLEKWVYSYLLNYKKNEVKETTIDTYLGIYRKHIQGTKIGKMKLKSITSSDFQKFYNEKVTEKYNAKTVRHIYILINSALNKAVQLKYISENTNIAVVIPKCQKYYADVLSVDHVAKIFHEAKEDSLYPIVALTMCTGLRKGEVMALKWENINFEARELYVEGNLCRVANDKGENKKVVYTEKILTPKTKNSKRTIPLIDTAIEALQIQQCRQIRQKEKNKSLFVDQGFVFTEDNGRTIRQRKFMDRFHDFLERYNLPSIRFHDLRHPYVKHTTKKYNSEKQKTQATKIVDLIAWGFCFCFVCYSKRSWTL